MRAFILAGGKGTRSLNPQLPKILTEIANKTILEYQMDEFAMIPEVTRITFILGHGADLIIKSIFDYKNTHEVKALIDYLVEDRPLGSAGMLYKVFSEMNDNSDQVFICLGDILPRGGIIESFGIWRNLSQPILNMILVHPNDHPQDSHTIVTDGNRMSVCEIIPPNKKDNFYSSNLSPVGLYFIDPKSATNKPLRNPIDLTRDIFQEMLEEKIDISAQLLLRRSQDIGTAERHLRAQETLARYGSLSKVLIFIDRDDTIIVDPNKHNFDTSRISLIPGVIDFLRLVNGLGIPIVCISNQPAIAMGLISQSLVDEQIKYIQELLNKNGAYVDAFAYCPHHPEVGHEGEISALKIECQCRKPKAGLLRSFATNHGFDTSECIIIGDSARDIEIQCEIGLRIHFSPKKNCEINYQHLCLTDFDQISQAILNYINKIGPHDNH